MLIEGIERKLKRTSPGLVDDLQQRSDVIADLRRFIEYAVRNAPLGAASETDLAIRTKTQPQQVRSILAALREEGIVRLWPPSLLVHRDTATELSHRVAHVVEQFHQDAPARVGISLDQLRERLPIDRSILDHLLAEMKAAGRLQDRHGYWASADHSAEFSGADGRHLEAIDALLRDGMFQPPGIDEICDKVAVKSSDAQRLLNILLEHGRLVRVEGGILFHREAVEAARDKLVAFLRQEGRLESVKFKYLLNTSRRFAIPLLDHLDTLGITRRDGHTRYLKES